MHVELWQWIVGGLAAVIVGVSKSGIPGAGILVVPMLAYAFGGMQSVGIMLPMIIFADIFAVIMYHRHALWDKLIRILPWVVVGMGFAFAVLWQFGKMKTDKDILSPVIGILVISMLVLNLIQKRLGPGFAPKSNFGTASTGISAGFATTVSNAAGPIMSIYLTALKLPKEQLMGTISWYFCIINLSKVPIYLYLTKIHPNKPMITLPSFLLDVKLFPLILIGIAIGKWLLPRISQKRFDQVVLVLAGIAAIKLIVG